MRETTHSFNGTPATAAQLALVRGGCCRLEDGETIRFDVTSKRTGRVVSFRLRRCSYLEIGKGARRFGCHGFYVDGLAGDWHWHNRVINGSPAWQWRVERKGRSSRIAEGLSGAILWTLDHVYGQRNDYTLDKLVAEVDVRVRIVTRDGRDVHVGSFDSLATEKGPLAPVDW